MTALPAKSTFDGTATPTTSTFKTAMGNLRDYLAGLFGATGTAAGAIAALGSGAGWAPIVTGGTATAFTLTPSEASTANAAGQRYRVSFHAASGATPTLAVSGQTAKNLKYYDGTATKKAITAKQVPINWISDVEYDGTDWVVLQPCPGAGTQTNDAAAAGYVGELIEAIANGVNATTTNQYGDITSITLTAGDWDVSAMVICTLNTGGTVTRWISGIGTVTGNDSTGVVDVTTSAGLQPPPTANYNPAAVVTPVRKSLAGSTTFYLKMLCTYGSGIPLFSGRISARRVR